MIEFLFEELAAMGFAAVLIGAWRALPLLAIVLIFDLLLRRRIAARFHCLLWALVMVRMLCPFSVPTSVSMHGAVDRMAEQVAGRILAERDAAAAVDPGYDIFTYTDDEGNSVTVPLLPDDASDQLRAQAEAHVAALTAPKAAAAIEEVDSNGESGIDWTLIVAYGVLATWFTIAFGMMIRGAAAYWRFARRLRDRADLADPLLESQVSKACGSIGVRRQPRVKELDGLSVPAVFGLWRHTICLPLGTATKLHRDELQWVLRHEIAHIRRRDSILLSVALFMRACHWFNPLAWLVVSRLRNHMEQAADDIAMRNEPEQSTLDYGRLLLRYASDQTVARQPATMGLLFVSSGHSLRQRIEMLDQNQHRNHWMARVFALLAIASIAITGLTDAKTIELVQESQIEQWPVAHLDPHSVTAPPVLRELKPSQPEVEVSYDVREVLQKIQEPSDSGASYEPKHAEIYLLSFFNQFSPGAARLEDGQLTVQQTASDHRRTKRMLEIWQRSGPHWQITLECRRPRRRSSDRTRNRLGA